MIGTFMAFSLTDLESVIAARAESTAEASYTRSLLDKGLHKCAEKFGEEAVVAVIAAVAQDKEALVNEAADVLFHLLIVLQQKDISDADVMGELESRTGQSGHAEKSSRTSSKQS